jgi:osmoprotectant transport system permease protein
VTLSVGLDAPGNPWFSWRYLRDNGDSLREALSQHVSLTVNTVLIATAIAIPMAIISYRVRWLAAPILGLTGVLYTIPSLALFAFLAPTLGLRQRTVLVGLVLYALLTLVRNTLTGLQQVPHSALDAARGMGYSGWQTLWRVELPLALPSIFTGLRIATVSTIALVTVGYIVGFGGFGTVILSGFNNNFYKAQIMAGTLGCLLLALVADLMLVAVAWLMTPWLRRRRAA